jgi:hypothetical protein
VALAFMTVLLFPKASSKTKIALTFSEVSGDVTGFFAFGREAAAVWARQVITCFRFVVLPEPERPMKMMDWSFLKK